MKDVTAFDLARKSATGAALKNIELIEGLYRGLHRLDLESVASLFTQDALYRDEPKMPAWDVSGPKGIISKIQLFGSVIKEMRMEIKVVVAQDHCVMTERTEDWQLKTGEVRKAGVTAVYKISDGKISYWNDYWDAKTAEAVLTAPSMIDIDHQISLID